MLESLALRFLLLDIGSIVCIDLYLIEERQAGAFRFVATDAGQGRADGWQTATAGGSCLSTGAQIRHAAGGEGLGGRLCLRLRLGLCLGLRLRLCFSLLCSRAPGLLLSFRRAFRLLDRSIVSLLAGGLFSLCGGLGLFYRAADHLLLVLFFARFAGALLCDGLADPVSALALLLHLSDGLLVHLNVFIDHHLFEEDEVFDRQNLLQEALMDTLGCALLRHDEVRLRDAQVLNVRLQLALYEPLEPRMHLGVVEAILLRVLEVDAVLLHETYDRVLPEGRLEKLGHDLEDPLLFRTK